MSETLKNFCRVSNEPDTITIYWDTYLCLFIETYLYCMGEYLYGDIHPFWASQVALVIKNLPANAGDAGDPGSIPGLGRCPAGGQGNPLQYSCLENLMDRGTWQVPKSQTRFSMHAYLVHFRGISNILDTTKKGLGRFFFSKHNLSLTQESFTHEHYSEHPDP